MQMPPAPAPMTAALGAARVPTSVTIADDTTNTLLR